ncbi:monocarboxylate transporter 3-like [Ruditapes philippinarum]|uniref:monocarboxylate transporter 3-like n=1 Tax=Ruditapes philippinarum TaxID=129788 RepID=UPI00295B3C5A|nr:monocarboxylate transporter 3-like [Ruditapes philippinarum]
MDEKHILSEETLLLGDDIPDDHIKREASKCRKACIFLSCFMQIIVCNGVGYGLSVMYAELVVVFDSSRGEAVLLQSLFMGFSSASGILFTGLIHRFGPGVCIMFGGLMGCVGLFVSAFTGELSLIIICTGVVAGTAFGVCLLAAFVTVGWTFSGSTSFFLICLMAGISVGQFTYPLLFETFISQYTWSGTFVLIAGVSMQCIPCGLIVYFSGEYLSKGTEKSETKRNLYCDVTMLKDLVMWIFLVNFVLISMSVNVEAWFIVDHMVTRGFKREVGSVLVSMIGIGTFIGRICGALLRLKCKCPTIYHWTYFNVIIAVIHVIILNLNDFRSLVVACIVYGMTYATCTSQIPGIMFESVGPERYPQAMAMANVMLGLGDMLGAIYGGFIYDIFGVYNVAFYTAAVMGMYISVTTTFAAVLVKRRNRREVDIDTKAEIRRH